MQLGNAECDVREQRGDSGGASQLRPNEARPLCNQGSGYGHVHNMQLFHCRLHTNDTSMEVGISSWLHHDMLCSQLIDDISLQRHSTHSCARFDVKVALFFCSIRSQLCAAYMYTCSKRTDVSSPVYCLYLTCCTLPNNDFQGSSVVVVTSSVTLRAGALRYG